MLYMGKFRKSKFVHMLYVCMLIYSFCTNYYSLKLYTMIYALILFIKCIVTYYYSLKLYTIICDFYEHVLC